MTTAAAARAVHTLEELGALTLGAGNHGSFQEGVCVNEAVAWFAGEEHSDRPQCMSPLIAQLTMSFNDRLPSNDERDRLLKPLIPLLVGTRTTAEDEKTRAYMAADWYVRQRAPIFLRLAGFVQEAETLEGLARIVDAETAKAARPVAREINDKLWRIRNERWEALREKAIAASAAIAASDAIDASAASDAIDASAASAAIAASDASDASAASAAIAAIAAIDASAASDASDASAAIAAIAASDAIAPESVLTAALRAAAEAVKKVKGGYWPKYEAAYAAARPIFDARLEEWPTGKAIKTEALKVREDFVRLLRDLAAVGRKEAA